MAIEKLVQNFADATGIIIDHTLNPPRVLGQAFLVSKTRLVTCAGCISNYADAPWALSVNFPHPGLVLGVKSIALHPDFDRKEARLSYLSQNAVTRAGYPVQVNDLATLVISPEVRQPAPEEVVALHKALSLPFATEGVEVSGALKEGEFIAVVKKLLASNRQGLLTLYDELNIPLAYVQLANAVIERVYFQGIVGEMAFAELVCRQPAVAFAFQPNYSFAWGDLKKIEISADDLISESIRRTQELPAFFSHLGGAKAIYQRVVEDFSAEGFNPNIQWLVNNLWHTIDGYITANHLSERVGADTYTVVQGLRELSNRGVVSIINKSNPFHQGGQFGAPIVSHTDFDINPGDALKAFYLDPISGAPCWQDGEFGGVASVLQPKNLLHSIPINVRVPGALILKNYKLIGVHNGPVQIKTGQSAERQLFQMMWIGALFEMGSKKLRTGADGTTEEEDVTITNSKLSPLRVREESEGRITKTTLERLIKYTCPVCFATNTKMGNCFNCGAVIDSAPVEVKRTGYFIDKVPVKVISDLQAKYNISDRNLFTGFGLVGIVIAFILLGIFRSIAGSAPANSTVTTQVQNKNADQAVKLAVDVVGFKGIAPPGYVFEDTSALTSPLLSFGLSSDSSNQKVLFVIFNDLSTVQALDRFIQIPPFCDVTAPNPEYGGKVTKIDEGSIILGYGDFHYYVHDYPLPTAENLKAHKVILVGSFRAKEENKSVLVVGQALLGGTYDYKSTLFLVDAMGEPLTLKANKNRLEAAARRQAPTTTGSASNQDGLDSDSDTKSDKTGKANQSDKTFATEDELSQYYKDLQDTLGKKSDQSDVLQEIVTKRKAKLKVVLEIDVNADGKLAKIDITEPDKDQKTNDNLVKLLSSSAPFKNVPKTENGQLNLRVVFGKGGAWKVEPR